MIIPILRAPRNKKLKAVIDIRQRKTFDLTAAGVEHQQSQLCLILIHINLILILAFCAIELKIFAAITIDWL